MNGNVVIVGAGPAGLANAYWRSIDDPAATVTVLESQARPGGWVQTSTIDGYVCELGPQGVRPNVEFATLVASLALEDRLLPSSRAARTRWIGRGGRLIAVPMGPGGLLSTRLLSLGGKLRILREPFIRRATIEAESVSAFVARRFGTSVVPLVHAMVGGIFAGDADRLEIASAFPALARAEREHGSVMRGMRTRGPSAPTTTPKLPKAALYSFRGGMSGLIDALAHALGDRVRSSCPVTSIARASGGYLLRLRDGSTVHSNEVVLACPARISATLVEGLDPELSRDLAQIEYASLASVYLGFRADGLPPTLNGFGFLLEPGESTAVLGAICCHSVFPGHAPPGHALVRVMLGGRDHPHAVDLDDPTLIGLASDALRRYTGLRTEIGFRHVVRVRDAIPQYESGHAERLCRIERRLREHPGLSLRGNSYRAIALPAQLTRAASVDSV